MERAIIFAVDFGTTFSGLAWAQSARPDIKATIVQWPDTEGSLEGYTSEKVPTELSYVSGARKWGFEIREGDDRHQWFKLGLDPSQENEVSHHTISYPDPKALPPTYNGAVGAVKLSTEFLTCLREHAVNVLRLKVGNGVVESTPIRFIVTVPAIWDDTAKVRTLRCALEAGMGNDVRIISEPEAAVIHALDAMDPHSLVIGDKFVLCDAGGGTVDLISYVVTELEPTVKVREAVAGSGDACGGIFLNRRFRKYLEEQLKTVEGLDDDTLEDAMLDFETSIKRKFTGEERNVIVRVIGLQDDASKNIRRQRMTISSDVLKSLFEPVIACITTLVKHQLRQAVDAKAVILVGGFGQSIYLRKCIEKIVGDGVEVLQPANGWTAVVRGALIRGLDEHAPNLSRISIASRVARKAYGIQLMYDFDGLEDDSRRKVFNQFDGRYKIYGMGWFIKRGDAVNQNVPVVASFQHFGRIDYGPMNQYFISIFSYAPSVDEEAPFYPCSDVKKMATLTADLSAISTSLIPIRIGADRRRYYELDFEIRVKFFSAHTEYSLWYRGKEYGKVNAEYV